MKKPKTFLNAMKWAYIGSWGEKGFSAIFTIVLAGIIGPKEFGVISLCLIYIEFLGMFLDQGFALAIVQRKKLEEGHLNSVFWLDVVMSLGLITISFLFANRWSIAEHSPQAAYIIPILSCCILFESLSVVQIALLKREMNFRALSLRSSFAIFTGGVVGIIMAILGYGVWALVAQQISREIVALVILWRASSWRPSLSFSYSHLKELFGFSAMNFVGQMGIFTSNKAAPIALGLFVGPFAVGLYRMADQVVGTIISIAIAATQSVSLSEFVRHQDNPEGLRQTAKTCLRLTAIVTIPALTGLAMVSRPLLGTIGTQWLPAADVLVVLCITGILIVFTYFTVPLMQALGQSRDFAVLEWGRTLVGLVMLLIAGFCVKNSANSLQILAIALARLGTAVFFVVPVFLWLLFRLSKITPADFIDSVRNPAIASACIIVAIRLVELTGWLTAKPAVVRLIAEVSIGAMAGLPVLLYLDLQSRTFLFSTYHRLIKRKAPSV